MRRFLGFSLAVIALGAISGCGGSGGGGSASSTIATIAASTASVEAFNGHYAFLLTGFDASGVPMAIAGSIAADGNGHVTGGSVDVNDNQVVNSNATVAGTYTVDVNHRGIISFTTAVPGITSLLAFAFTMRTDGTQATIIGFDNNNFVISGTMQQQTSSALSLAQIAGNFAYETDSHAPQPMQRSNIGSFTLTSAGAASGIFDASIAGSGPVAATSTAFTAQYNAPTTTTGRGTGTVNTTQSFVYYIISASKFVAIETDTAATSATLGATVATKQTIPQNANTTGAVFAVTGLDTSLGNTISAVGQIVVTGSAANFTWDSNDDATIFPGQVSGGPATVAYDPTTGRGTITALNQASSGLFNSAVFLPLRSRHRIHPRHLGGISEPGARRNLNPANDCGNFCGRIAFGQHDWTSRRREIRRLVMRRLTSSSP